MSATDAGAEPIGLDRRLREEFKWYSVAKKEFTDAIRSRGLLVLSVLFVTIFIAPIVGQLYLDIEIAREFGMQILISQVYLNLVTVFVPVIAIFVGYAAVTRERASGSLKLLLSLPFSRRDVIVGKVVGRSVVVGVPLLAAFVLTALFLVVSELTFRGELFGLFVLYTTGFTVVYVAIAVSISGASPSSRFSGVTNFVVYLYVTYFWNFLVNGLGDLLNEYLGVSGSLRWHLTLVLKLLNPSQAYKTLANSMLSEGADGPLRARFAMFSQNQSQMETICTGVLNGEASTVNMGFFGNRTVCSQSAGGLPFYFSDAAVFVYLLLWILVAAALSYYTFNRYDL